MTTATQTNGQAAPGFPTDRAHVHDLLTGQPFTQGYEPSNPLWALDMEWLPTLYLFRDVEIMLKHPQVISALNYYKSGIAGAEFWGGEAPDGNEEGLPVSDSQEVAGFVLEQCQRFWDRGAPKLQNGYEFGWIGAESRYADVDSMLRWDGLEHFSPRDAFVLTKKRAPVGVRVKNIKQIQTLTATAVQGTVDLWLASANVPGKGMWYVHNPRYNSFYGQSQLIGAWWPWRRCAWKDSAEMNLDASVYRFAFDGGVIYYPDDDPQTAMPGTPGTALDGQGNPRRFNRDVARQLTEYRKAGSGIGLPSTCYPEDQGGERKWVYEHPQNEVNCKPVMEYVEHLYKQISLGIGVAPELIEAAETGSGYSGRQIPMIAFMEQQQRVADAMLTCFVQQALKQLVLWNFGPSARFHVVVKPLLMTRMKKMAAVEGEKKGKQGGPEMFPGQSGATSERMSVQQPRQAAMSIDESLVTDKMRDVARRSLEAARRVRAA